MNDSNMSIISLMLVCKLVVVGGSLPLHAERIVTPLDSGEIVASDYSDMRDYAQSQYTNLINRLEVARGLTDQHKEFVATALSKDLEGLPLCSFDQQIVYQEESDKNELRVVTVHEDGLLTDNQARKRIFSEWKYSPFSAPPAAGIDFSSAVLLEETDSTMTFQFRFDKKAKSPSENVSELLGDLGRVAKNLRYELIVDAQNGAPKSLVLELIKPTRVMVVARVKLIRHEYHYEFDQSLQRYVIPKQSVEYAYSAPTRGSVEEKIDVTYSNFECQTPVRYVWHVAESLSKNSSPKNSP